MLKGLLKEKDYISKVDLKDIPFCVSLDQDHRTLSDFNGKDKTVLQIHLPMFWVLPSFTSLYKTFKISSAILHGININNLHRQFIVAESDCKRSGRWSKIH